MPASARPSNCGRWLNAWRSLYDLVRPDLVIFEHAPTAILATYAAGIRGVNIGTGFCCPPDRSPLPDWRPYLKNDRAQLDRDEAQVLAVINELLISWGQPPAEKVTDLYSRVNRTILATFPEIDHFGPRAGVEYWGTWSGGLGQPPEWPTGEGRRVFAYLKPFAALPALLERLVKRRLPTVVFGPKIDAQTKARFQGETLRFASGPVELGAAGKWCDIAILNATHGTTASMLLAGRPILQIPLFLEQQLTANNVERMGAGLGADQSRPNHVVEQFERLLAGSNYAAAAERFRLRHADFDGRRQLDKLTSLMEHLV